MTPAEFLGAASGRDGTFDFGRRLHGAFGGVFGGALAAATVLVARDAAPSGRVPASLDCRFLRALPAGRARAAVTVLHTGRSMTTVVVDLVDDRDRTTTHSTVTLVEPAALAPLTLDADDTAGWSVAVDGGEPWGQPPGFEAPIIDTLKPRAVDPHRSDSRIPKASFGILQSKREGDPIITAIDVPWDDPAASAEAVCLAADLSVGPPVAVACRDRHLAHPNPDLSLRFANTPLESGVPVAAAARLSSLAGGVATVAIDVAAGGRGVGVGVSFSVLLESG